MERRNFLKTAGLIAGSAAFMPHFFSSARAQTPHAERKFGYAVLGLGKYATEVILPNFNTAQNSELVAVISGDQAKADFYAKKYKLDPHCAYSYENMHKIAENPAIDAVYIITPNATHRHFTERAFQYGKHVMCEKPMATTIEDCHAMAQAAQKNNKILMIGYRVHFDPLTRQLITKLKSGAIGTPQLIQTANMENQLPDRDMPYLKWRLNRKMAGSGSLGDLGIYGINASRYLSNKDPVAVRGHQLSAVNDVDAAMSWTLYYENGMVAEGASSFCSAGCNRFAIIGDVNYLEIQPGSSYYNNQAKFFSNGHGSDHVFSQPYFQKYTATQWGEQLDALPASLLSGKPSAASWQEGLRDVEIINAIIESAAQKGKMIDISTGAHWAKELYGSEGLWSVL